MLFYMREDSIPLPRAKAAAPDDSDLVKPNLHGRPGPVDMNVGRLIGLMTVEVKPKAIDAQDRRHTEPLLRPQS
jgi:hypothetical protein